MRVHTRHGSPSGTSEEVLGDQDSVWVLRRVPGVKESAPEADVDKSVSYQRVVMNVTELAQNLSPEAFLDLFRTAAAEIGREFTPGVEAILRAIVANPDLAGKATKVKNRDELELARRWLTKYWKGYDNRASKRVSRNISTVPDPAVHHIIGGRLDHLTAEQEAEIKYGHRLGMQAENALGLLLEEYLATRLEPYGWYCAWGETLKSIDFVHASGTLLQVKNRSNSENSSSASVRKGTTIVKWYRIDAQTGSTHWHQLDALVGDSVSEEDFLEFVLRTVEANPQLIALEPDNVWRTRRASPDSEVATPVE